MAWGQTKTLDASQAGINKVFTIALEKAIIDAVNKVKLKNWEIDNCAQ